MEKLDGIQLDHPIGATDRGTLWSATRQRKGDRIVRIIEPRFCDGRFRQSLVQLRERLQPRMLPVVGEGWYGLHYYVEYRADSRWETLDAHFARLHWRQRLEVIRQICDILPQWMNAPLRPLGLNGLSIVMFYDAGRWFSWLLPCPSVQYESPCDFFSLPASIIATLAPEVIRGVDSDYRTLDSYALGAIAGHALGCKESVHVQSDDQQVELQACGALLPCDIPSSSVETFLHAVEPVKKLVQIIHHHTQISPAARLRDFGGLAAACAEVLAATDPVKLAKAYLEHQDPRQALKVLEWGFMNLGDSLTARLLAAEICENIEEYELAIQHLDHAVNLKPTDIELRRRRCNLRFPFYLSQPPLDVGKPDPEGDLLIEDIAWIKGALSLDPTEKNVPYVQAGLVYRHRRNLPRAAEELYQAAELEKADLAALYLYTECLRELGDLNSVRQAIDLAQERIERMARSELLGLWEAKIWAAKFDGLLRR